MGLFAPFLILAAAGGFAAGWFLGLRRCNVAAAERDRALAAGAEADRTARVWAADLRAAAMTVQGEAEQYTTHDLPPQDQARLDAALRRFVALTDELQDQIASAVGLPVLHLAQVALQQVLQEAIEAVAGGLSPGQRRWRVAAGLAGQVVWADRRALSQVLQRVLGNAARHSRAGDWIEVSLDSAEDGLALAVEEEGSGLRAPDRAASAEPPQRSGLRLARRLMEAHGGSLTTQTTEEAGTRVVLWFPADRVIYPPPGAARRAQHDADAYPPDAHQPDVAKVAADRAAA